MKIAQLRLMYGALKNARENFNPNNYKWQLGAQVIHELQLKLDDNQKIMLFGIEVEADFVDVKRVKLYEDITDQFMKK